MYQIAACILFLYLYPSGNNSILFMGEIMDIKQGTYFSNGKTYKHRGEDV